MLPGVVELEVVPLLDVVPEVLAARGAQGPFVGDPGVVVPLGFVVDGVLPLGVVLPGVVVLGVVLLGLVVLGVVVEPGV